MAKNIWSGTAGSPVNTFNIDTDRRDLNVANEILELQPAETPFMVIGNRTSNSQAQSLEETWYDDDLAPWWTTLSASYLAADTTISLTDASIVKPKDLIKNTSTGEVMFVESISGNNVTVVRGYGEETGEGGTAAADSTGTNDNIMRMGNAMEENSNAPESRATQPNKYYNYVQTFRTPFEGSLEDLKEPKKAGTDERTRLRRRKAVEHKLDLERAYLFGERNEHISDKRRLMGGLFQFLTNEVVSIGGSLTENLFEEALEEAFRYGSKEKILITSPRVGSVINKFARDKIQTRSGEDYYGLRIAEYISFHGTLYVATSHMFEKDYEGMGAILDMENIDIMPFAGMNTTLRTNLQDNDLLGWKDEYVTMSTLRVRLQKTHKVLDGITFA